MASRQKIDRAKAGDLQLLPPQSPAAPQTKNRLRIATAEELDRLEDADIVLLPGRAALLPATQTLVCADVHLGKAATFRRAGLPVPEGSAQQDLKRLTGLVERYEARRLIIAGDLFHARAGCTPQVLREFTDFHERLRRVTDPEVVLVLGNHERSLGRQFSPYDLGIDCCVEELIEPPFRFVHEPAVSIVDREVAGQVHRSAGRKPESNLPQSTCGPDASAANESSTAIAAGEPSPPAGSFTIAGHLHPTISLRSPSGDRLSGRCFVAVPGLLVLPAFGSFTGGHRVVHDREMQIWLADEEGACEVTGLFR